MKKTFTNPIIDNDEKLFMADCGQEQCSKNQERIARLHRFHILHYVIKGKGTYYVNDKKYSIKPGDLFAIYPRDLVMYQADPADPWRYVWISVGGNEAGACFNQLGIDYNNPVVHLTNEVFMEAVLGCLDYSSVNKFNISQYKLRSYLYDAFSGIEASIKTPPSTAELKRAYVDSAIAFMECHYIGKLSISDIVKHVKLERSYFYRIFLEEKGVSPKQYLTNMRMKKAKELIKNNVPFKQIAHSVGVSDVYHFTAMFKKVFGITPSAYRDIAKKDNKE